MSVSLTNILGGLASIAQGIAGLASGTGGLGETGPPGLLGSPDFGLDLAAAGFLGEFFSPALRLAAETCESCPDSRLDLLRLLVGLFQAAEAEAAGGDEGERPPKWWAPFGRPGGIARPGGKNKPIEYRPPTPGQKRHWEDLLKTQGRDKLEQAKKSLQADLEKHYRALTEINRKGGYANPVERTILREQNDLKIITDLLGQTP